jgi:PII-like signaling protein
VIEIVDSEEKIEAFLPQLGEMVGSGLVTLEKVQVLQYGKSKQ